MAIIPLALTGCATRFTLTEAERSELMQQAEGAWAAYMNAEAAVESAENALHQKAPEEAAVWKTALETVEDAAMETENLWRLEIAAGFAHERADIALAYSDRARLRADLANPGQKTDAEIASAAASFAALASALKSAAAERARFSPESVEAADDALNSADIALADAINALRLVAPLEWAIYSAAAARRDVAWAILNQAADLKAKEAEKAKRKR
ncbi:MAG: hypothetical protein OXT69_02985 [Candidatus Poribacteria bacterium]|nr:hypothetical protein [Candidatus Poribacteria bacterium]